MNGMMGHRDDSVCVKGRPPMTKEIRCGSLVPGCDWHATGDTEEDLLSRAAAHARQAHEVVMTPELLAKAKRAIHEVGTA